MDKKLKKIKDYYYVKYYKDGTTERIKNGVFDEIGNKRRMGIGEKLVYFSTAAVLLVGILIGSAFISPTVAKVLAQIPILNNLFEEDSSLVGGIMKDLEELDYSIAGISSRVSDKSIEVYIQGSESYFKEVQKDIEQEINDVLQAKGMDAYHVKVSHHEDREVVEEELSEEQKKKVEEYTQQSNKLENAIMAELDKQNYDIFSAHVRINDMEKFIPLEIPVSETRVDEMKAIVNNIVKEMDMGEFSIKVYKTDPEIEKAEMRWMPVINTISEGLIGVEDLKVEGVGYSFYPLPLTFSIRTSIDSTDSNAEELAKEIERTVRQFIESEEVEENVKDDPYNINVYSKDEKKIN